MKVTGSLRATMEFEIDFDVETLSGLIQGAAANNVPLTEYIQYRIERALMAVPPEAAPSPFDAVKKAMAEANRQQEALGQQPMFAPPIEVWDGPTQVEPPEEKDDFLKPPAEKLKPVEPLVPMPDKLEPGKLEPEPKWPEGLTKKRAETPVGVLNILALAERVLDIRKQALSQTGSAQNRKYATTMDRMLKDAGLSFISPALRQELYKIGNDGDAILTWATPQVDALDHLTPSGLLYRWERQKRNLTTQARGRPRIIPKASQSATAGPALRKATPLTQPRTVNTTDPYPDAIYKSFSEVSQARLNSYDARVLRRFTDQLRRLPHGPQYAKSTDLAGIIREIRGNERGDTPFCAQRLAALGVLIGVSGSYTLRKEYLSSDYFTADQANLP